MSTAPIKPPPKACRVCGLSASDLVHDEKAAAVVDAVERLGGRIGEWYCPDPDRCRRVLKGLPLSDDRKYGDVKKVDPDDWPEPPPPNYPGEKPPPRHEEEEPPAPTNGVSNGANSA